MKYFTLGLIAIYQKLLSPDHSWVKVFWPYGYCRFYPSCSEYTFLAVERFGAVKGAALGIIRLASCNPFSRPGHRPLIKPSIHHL